MATYTITADSIPDYDSFGIDDYWSCDDWISWHKALKNKYGKTTADQTWLNAWDKQDAFEHNYNWCKYASTFNNYVRSEKLSVTHLLADIIVGGTNVGENIVDAGVGASKAIKWIIPAIIIIVAIGALIYFGNKYKILKLN